MELYIKSIDDPNFTYDQIQVDEEIQLLLTQIETLVFTSKGDVMGMPDFGLNLEDYIYSFMYNDNMIKGMVENAISEYIPLSKKYPVSVNVEYTSQTERNVVYIDISVDGRYGIGLYV